MEDWVWNMDYDIWNIEYGIWNVECGMDSAGDCCPKISRCIFDGKVLVISGMRTESKAGLQPGLEILVYIYI